MASDVLDRECRFSTRGAACIAYDAFRIDNEEEG